MRLLVLTWVILAYPLLLACDRVDRFAADPPAAVAEAVTEAVATRTPEPPTILAVKGIVGEAIEVDDGIRLSMQLEVGPDRGAELAVFFARPGTSVPTGQEAHVLGYLEQVPTRSHADGLRMRAVGIYIPATSDGFYLRAHESEFVAWSMGKLTTGTGAELD
jgi:hypothetical protein